MIEKFFPHRYYESAYKIDYEKYYKMGKRLLIFDVDNTLALHDAPDDGRAAELFRKLSKCGFINVIISNNGKERVSHFADKLNADHYIYDAHKPLAYKYVKAMRDTGFKRRETLFVGDQIFTDIWGANNAGIESILVKPLGKEKLLKIRLKRLLEKPIIKAYIKKYGDAIEDNSFI